MKRLDLTEIARADLDSIRRYSTRSWGQEQTTKYMNALGDTLKGLIRGTIVARGRDDLRPGIMMATSGRHCIFFEADNTASWSSAYFTTGWTIAATSALSFYRLYTRYTSRWGRAIWVGNSTTLRAAVRTCLGRWVP